jgi:hypothetical protein
MHDKILVVRILMVETILYKELIKAMKDIIFHSLYFLR